MKYLPLRELDIVTNALNFSTADCHVIGSCDIYTTKAAGGDRKLYKNIEHNLESQYESLVRLSASLSPPCRTISEDGKTSDKEAASANNSRNKRGGSLGIPEMNLSRASPFGPLSQINARRTFAYLIATLNASHPDYDFSHRLRPSDFRKERSLRTIMHNVDSTLQNLRPRANGFSSGAAAASYLVAPSSALFSNLAPAFNTSGSEVWSPKMWSLVNQEMDLRNCEKFSYAPDDDPFDGDEGDIWSMHYLFFNKEKKRVCYLYLRGLSVISHSPVYAPMTVLAPRRRYRQRRPNPVRRKASSVPVGEGAGKRAMYWLGTPQRRLIDTDSYDDDDDDEMVLDEQRDAADDEVEEVPYMDLDDIRDDLVDGSYYMYGAGACEEDDYFDDDELDDGFLDEGWTRGGGVVAPARRPRAVSEDVGDCIEI